MVTYLLTTGALTLAGGGMAVGVLASGVLTTWFGWRSVFLVNVPVGLTAGVAARLLVPRPWSRRDSRSWPCGPSRRSGPQLRLR
jgi:MFS family permease